jgi:mycothiol synthase
MTIATRNYKDRDLEAIVELINAADAVDQLDEGTSISEFREILSRPDFDPYRDALVALSEDQHLVGHSRLDLIAAPQQSRFYVHSVVHPDWRDQGVERLMLEQLWSRAQERRQALGGKPVQLRAYCAAFQDKRIALFEDLGLRPVRYDLHMVYHPLDNLAEARIPPGIQVRPFARGLDNEAALETVNEAFADVMDHAPVTPEEFDHWIESPSFQANLSSVALDGQSVIGLCLCTVSEGRADVLGRRDGYVDTLCVIPEYRRRGLGSALLLTSLRAMKKAGLGSATLDASTDNPTEAIRIYERAGFREAWRWVTYGSELK